MKLNYTACSTRSSRSRRRAGAASCRSARPVGVLALHGQLAPVAWALAQARAGRARSATCRPRAARCRAGISRHGRASCASAACSPATSPPAPAFGGEREAITTAGALHHGLAALGWDAASSGPGPGILGSGSALGHGGMAALDSAHAALALGCPTLLVARMSSGDPRARHRGLSHHTRTVLELLLAPVALPRLAAGRLRAGSARSAAELAGARARRERRADHAPRLARGGGRPRRLPRQRPAGRTMGRALDEDPLFFAARARRRARALARAGPR